jgi:methionyl-tRNA formyltransferase
MRVIFFGTLCIFSTAPLRLLIETGHAVGAVLLPSDQSISGRSITPLSPPHLSPIPLVDAMSVPSIVSLAWQHQIPVYQINRLAAPEVLAALRDLKAEVACVACFPKRIPGSLLSVPRWGFLNVHPSLLPHYRGPYPQFWALRRGDRHFGVTIHFMNEQLDAGDIAAQTEVDLPDGLSGEEIDSTLSQDGAELLLTVLHQLETHRLRRHAQPPGGSYFPMPQASDFVIDASWSAQHAFNFMRGADQWERPYPIELAGERFILKQALFYSRHEVLQQPYRVLGEQIDIQFSPGVLRALLA